MVTDLLATCAIGENTGVDSICCTIYSESELIEIISSDEISVYRKRPFMKLLVWVYMNVQDDERASFYRKNLFVVCYNIILRFRNPCMHNFYTVGTVYMHSETIIRAINEVM